MLPLKHRLKKKKDFERVYQGGRYKASAFLLLKIVNNDLAVFRAGFVVSKKISSKAVIRNKVKRWLREATRSQMANIKSGHDLIFLARPGIEKQDFHKIKEKVLELLKALNLLEKNA